MQPAALSFVEGDPSFRQPMGIVVIGGLMTSTVLTLDLFPVVFTFADDLEQFFVRLISGKPTSNQIRDQKSI